MSAESSNNENPVCVEPGFFCPEKRTRAEQLPVKPSKVMEILMQIHEAIVKQASTYYSSTDSKEPVYTDVCVNNDRIRYGVVGECLFFQNRAPDNIKKSPNVQKLRQEQALDVIRILEEEVNLELWDEKEKPTPELRRRYVLNSIIQAFRDRMDPHIKEDRSEIENAWYTLGCFILDRVSGADPLEYKNTLTPWVLPIIGEASKMLLRGIENTYWKVELAPWSPGKAIEDDMQGEASFHDIECLAESRSTGYQPFGRIGIFSPHRDDCRIFFSRKNKIPTRRESDFYRVLSCLPWGEGTNCFDPEPKEGINVLSTILDVLLDYRIFSEPLFKNYGGYMGGKCTTITSSTYYSFIRIIDEILSDCSEDDEETRDAKLFAREIICCLMICVNHFWKTVKIQSRTLWRGSENVEARDRTEEMFKYFYLKKTK